MGNIPVTGLVFASSYYIYICTTMKVSEKIMSLCDFIHSPFKMHTAKLQNMLQLCRMHTKV